MAPDKKVNTDLFALTYGSMISQLLIDCDNEDDVNYQLERMGYNIGRRLIEDYLAKSPSVQCRNLEDVAERIQNAFQLYLNVVPSVVNWSSSNDEFSILLHNNPLTEFVEIPDSLQKISYLNVLPGVIRGALEMVSVPVSSWIQRDQLKGDSETEIRVKSMQSTRE